MRMLLGVIVAGLALAATPAAGQEVTLGGQVRQRFEYRNPAAGGTYDWFTSMRVRASLAAALTRQVSAFVQVQDVRIWGEETSTVRDYDADGLDLHQGYVEFRGAGESVTRVRAGRQSVALGGQRLVGPIDWLQQGQAFDGITARLGTRRARVNLLAMRLADASAGTHVNEASLAGAYAELEGVGRATLDLYGLYNGVTGEDPTDQVTFGARLHQQAGRFPFRLEATYQAGTRGGDDVAAFLLGGRIGTGFGGGRGSVTLWYDYLSGDDVPDDGRAKVFSTLFATNHKFYGFADLFLDIPSHTGGLGLQDAALKGTYRVREDFSLAADVHAFRTARRGSLPSARLGEEVDLTATYRYTSGVSFVGGISWVVDGPALRELGRLREDLGWAYLMLDVVF